MPTKPFSRRQFLRTAAYLGISTSLAHPVLSPLAWAKEQESPRLLSCAQQQQQDYLVCADMNGQTQYQFTLPERGHGLAVNPNQDLGLVFSRRPGRYITAFDPQRGKQLWQHALPRERHCYGHGCFSADGLLYVSEGDTASSQGVIGVYQVDAGLKQIALFSDFGIGPHEIIMHPDQQHLIVAVGGIATQGREMLNLASMAPRLVYLNRHTGKLVHTVTLGDHLLSIRHLAVATDGTVAMACQYQGDTDILPLLYRHRLTPAMAGEISQGIAVMAAEEDWLRFNDYLGSVAILDEQIITTSPRGNGVGRWHKDTGQLLGIDNLNDVCGLAVIPHQGVMLTTGTGIIEFQAQRQLTPWAWDNHALALV
ncbi:DUF1513 domain-containing protein [Motilimonas sp. KMU-193]|uniref:DUF1513 domain-containing protein n=1 Tax=Motilimonas sp. KMU-193 TaxID=3388668 RepID=UPI00396B0196